ncbi:MAG: AmmeMemoRadiSam system protein B [Phycisphaerae bacterium]|nr:AmmeMemoRadiSam system protein B [Phycisphaerae bacterium]
MGEQQSLGGAGSGARFDPELPHQARPKLRPVRGFPVQATSPDGKQQTMLGVADARQISDKIVVTAPAAQFVLPLMDGTRGLDQIVAEVGRGLNRQILEPLVAQLDDAGLLEGPVFEALAQKLRSAFDASPVLPPASSAAFADAIGTGEEKEGEAPKGPASAARLRTVLDSWIKQALDDASDPSFDALPKAIVVPHLDYFRGAGNYASAYGRLRVVDRPDRIVILGTNHFGSSTGVCGCDKGYETPLGVSPLDSDMEQRLRRALGDVLFEHRFDHEREHSIELQIMWLQHVFGLDERGGHVPVFGALVHDPAVRNGDSYDGKGVAIRPFVDALRAAIAELPGKTLVISSADLSHVGPSFGDEKPLAGDDPETAERRNRVFNHDREMLQHVLQNNPEALIASMAWQQNPTRWCSTGNLVATLLTVQPTDVKLLNYAAAMDQQGTAMVSSVAMVMN